MSIDFNNFPPLLALAVSGIAIGYWWHRKIAAQCAPPPQHATSSPLNRAPELAPSQLSEVNRSYRELLESAPTAIVIGELATSEILFCNPLAAALIGLHPDELIGRPASALYLDSGQRARLVADLQAGKPVRDVEMPFIRADGTSFWVRASSRLTSYEGREAIVSVWEDITEQRETERLLRRSEKNHRLALSAAPFPLIIASSADRSLLLLNRRAMQALRVAPDTRLDSLLTDNLLDAAVRAEVGQMLGGGSEITDREALIRPLSGMRFWALVSARTIEFEGQPAFILSFTDISDHKQIEREIAESRSALRSMINASPIWMAMIDRSGYYQLVNRAFEQLLGRQAASIEGKHYSEILPPTVSKEHASYINRCIEGEEVQFESVLDDEVFQLQSAENSAIQVHGQYSPVIAPDGGVSGGVLVMMDISARHLFEEKLKAQLAETQRLHRLLKEQVIRDPLTGLFNRRYLDETLDRELSRARRSGYPISVIMLDIDHFKRLNDTYGHQAGDEVLKGLAQLLSEGMREGDIACRYGGEEFTLVLPNANTAVAHERAEYWRLHFEKLTTTFGRFALKSTISLGVAAYPEHGNTRDQLIQAADKALYQSKNAGRNTVHVFAPQSPPADPPP